MFEYFEDHYVWNMAVNLALAMGGSIGDIDDASRSLSPLAKTRDHSAAEQFYAAWIDLGMKLKRLAATDEARGRSLSAGAKYRRAFIYFIQAERMQRPDFVPRQEALPRGARLLFAISGKRRKQTAAGSKCRIRTRRCPHSSSAANTGDGDAPCMVHFDGLDVTKEIIYLLGIPDALAARGIATLVVDNPGVGESLRLKGLHNFPEAEVPAKAAVDFLQIDARHRSRSHRHHGAVARRLSCAARGGVRAAFQMLRGMGRQL